ncbi:hypothetical protein TRV_02797, partial [Trichophyton verrucosum HKI 0517]
FQKVEMVIKPVAKVVIPDFSVFHGEIECQDLFPISTSFFVFVQFEATSSPATQVGYTWDDIGEYLAIELGHFKHYELHRQTD